jgi:hypothetical protein
MKLLSSGNPKTLKSVKKGFLTFILHLAPANLSGYNVCPGASKGCTALCLNTSGRGKFDKIQAARIRKTKMFFENRDEFMRLLVKDIEAGIRKAIREGLTPTFRLNGTSDIRWENIKPNLAIPTGNFNFPMVEARNIFEAFPDVQFYDYTKLSNRRNIPANYHLTFSRSEENGAKIPEAFDHGMNVAVVFSTPKNGGLPTVYLDRGVIDGDDTDMRFADAPNVFVGLRAKGDAIKSDGGGFVVNV